jgi:hypothetical protein
VSVVLDTRVRVTAVESLAALVSLVPEIAPTLPVAASETEALSVWRASCWTS